MGKKFVILPLIIIIAFGFFVYFRKNNQTITPERSGSDNYNYAYYDKELMNKAVIKASDDLPQINKEKIKGAVIPHHELANYMVAQLFVKLQKQKPQTIILIGPNHYEAGNSLFVTGNNDWQTDYGVLNVDRKLLSTLSDYKNIRIDDDVISKDHAITGIIPFIKYYLPETKVVNFLVSGYIEAGDVGSFSDYLYSKITPDTVIIISTDFSHYLSQLDASKKDKETIKTIQEKNIAKLLEYQSDNLDSPGSVAILISLMGKSNSIDLEVIENTSSGLLTKDMTNPVTSYFFLVY